MQLRRKSFPKLGIILSILIAMLISISIAICADAEPFIQWTEYVKLEVDAAKYVRVAKIEKGPKSGHLIMTYGTKPHGGSIMKRYSQDDGLTWSNEQVLMPERKGRGIFNANIIQLDDGRLMLVYQDRDIRGAHAKTCFVMVKYSSDAGDTWSAPEIILRASHWEPRQIQVKHDENRDGNNDIYVFLTNHFFSPNSRNDLHQKSRSGQGVTYIVSYNNGVSWVNYSDEDYTGKIVFRSFREQGLYETGSEGGMPTPFIIDNNRLAFVAESVHNAGSPWIIAADPNDWGFHSFRGKWTSIEYDGFGESIFDDFIYPRSKDNRWKLPSDRWGGAPFAANMPNGQIVYAYNSGQEVWVYLSESDGKNLREQEQPFENAKTFYPGIVALGDSKLLVTAHDKSKEHELKNIYIRIGYIRR